MLARIGGRAAALGLRRTLLCAAPCAWRASASQLMSSAPSSVAAQSLRQFSASASSSASPAPSTTELSPEEFFCLHAPSGGMIGARTLQLIHKSMLDWPQFANNAKVLFDSDVRSLGTAAGLSAFCEQHKTSAKFFDFDSQPGDVMYARHTLGALHVMRSMMDGMPKTIDVVAKATGNPNPVEWTGEVMGKIAQECTTQFLQHAPMGANTAFIAAFGKHGEDTSPAMRSSLQGAFHTLCVNIKETEKSGGEAAAAPTSQS